MTKFRGNLDGSLLLKSEAEAKLFWCRLKLSPGMVSSLGKEYVVKAFRKSAWDNFETVKNRDGVEWWSTLGHFDGMELLHDPRLIVDINELEIVE